MDRQMHRETERDTHTYKETNRERDLAILVSILV